MRFIATILLLFSLNVNAQFGDWGLVTTPEPAGMVDFSFTELAYTATDSINPGRGAEQWHNGSEAVSNPTATYNVPSLDVYYRFQWGNIEGSTQDSYTWGFFDGLVNACITSGQQFSFGIMTVYTGGGVNFYDGGSSAYPLYLHNLMQAETANSRDWLSGGSWIPNFNSTNYQNRLRALHTAINNHINSTSFVPSTGPHAGQTIQYADVIYCIDIRGYGNYGEWHSGGYATWSTYPTGRQPTAAALKEIIDTHTEVFTQWPLSMMVAAFDGGMTGIDVFVPLPEVAYYALTATNAWDSVGWRRDQWGAKDSYLETLLAGNTTTYGGSAQFRYYIIARFKRSPITGEPPSYVTAPAPYYDELEAQAIRYGATSIGNGNWGTAMSVQDAAYARATFKRCGYRLKITTGQAPQAITRNVAFQIKTNWQNVGIAPTYNNWTVQFELQDEGSVIWTGTSSKVLKHFRPDQGIVETTDNLTVPGSVSAGTYKLVVRVRDTENYRPNMKLAIVPRNTDGTYTIVQNVVVN